MRLAPSLLACAFVLCAAAAPATQYNIFQGWTTFDTPRFDGGPVYPGFVCNNISACIEHANDRGGSATFVIFSSDFYDPYDEDFPPITVPIEFQLWEFSGNEIEIGGGLQIGVPGDSGSLTLPPGDATFFNAANTDSYVIDIVAGSVTMPGGSMEGGLNGVRVGPASSFVASDAVLSSSLGVGIVGAGGNVTLENTVVSDHISDGVRFESPGGSLVVTSGTEFRDNFGNGVRVLADVAMDIDGASFSGNGGAASALAWTDNATDTSPDVIANTTFSHTGPWTIRVQDGSYVERVDLIDPVFTGQNGTEGALLIGDGGTGDLFGAGGFRIAGSNPAAKVDLSAPIANGAARFARVLAGGLSFTACTASGISGDEVPFVDSKDSGPLGADVQISFDQCAWLNGAGSYACLNDGGGPYGVFIEGRNTVWAYDSTATHDLLAFLSLRGDQAAAGSVDLRHCALKAGGSAGRIRFHLVEAAKRLNGTNFASRGDSLSAGWSIFDSSSVQSGVAQLAGSNVNLMEITGFPSAPNIAWRTTGEPGFLSVPVSTIIQMPGLVASGPTAGYITEFSAASAQAANSPFLVDIDGAVRPQPDGSTPDIGANEIIGDIDSEPPTGTVVINNDDVYTNSLAVTLNLSADDGPMGSGVSEMRFAPGDDNYGPWIPYNVTAPFTLEPVGNGTRTVQAQFRDLFGNVSLTASDDIIADVENPTTALIIEGGAAAVATSAVELSIGASDNLSGVESMRFANEGDSFGAFIPYAPTFSWNLAAGDGVRTVRVQVQDVAGNISDEALDDVIVDATNPDVLLSSAVSGTTSLTEFDVIAEFTETVTGFEQSDLLSSNATITGFVGMDDAWVITLQPIGVGNVNLRVPAASAFDDVGNPNNASNTFSVVFDNSGPSLDITSTVTDPTNVTPIPVTFTFSDPVTGFEETDVQLTNATLQNFAGVDDVYTADILPTADGLVEVSVPDGAAIDGASNASLAGSYQVTFDGTAPGVAVMSAVPDPTNVSPIPFTVEFTEPVFGFEASDASVTNGSAVLTSGADGDQTYALNVTPSGDGPVTVSVPAAVATDGAGNPNTASPSPAEIFFDATGPTLVLSSTASSPTSVSPIPVTAAFSEPVTGFAPGDIVVFGATLQDFNGSLDAYTFELVPDGEGLITLLVGVGAASDSAGNPSGSASFDIEFNTSGPTVTLSTSSPNPTNVSPIPVTAVFSEAPQSFTALNVTATNATVVNFSGSGAVYTFGLDPVAEGPVTAQIVDDAVTDGAGNGNTASNLLSVVYDATGPTVTLSTAEPDPTNVSPVSVTVEFNEAVNGFEASDLGVTNGSAVLSSGVDGDSLYTIDVTPTADGLVAVNLPAAAAMDLAGNPSSAAMDLTFTYDATSPALTLATTASDPTNQSPIPFTASFNEPVIGFDATDVVAANGVVSNFNGSADAYSFDVTPDGDGVVTVSVAPAAAEDDAGNPSLGDSLAVEFDATAPTVLVATTAGDPTNLDPIPVIVSFSEPVLDFSLAGLSLTNAVAEDLSGTDATYAFNLRPQAEGIVSVQVLAAAAADDAGNANVASNELSLTYDITGPTPTLSAITPLPATASPILVQIVFDEEPVGFEAADFAVTDGVAQNLTGGPLTWQVEIDPTIPDGDVIVSLPAAVATDAAGNPTAASNELSLPYDSPSPEPLITSSLTDPTNVEPIPLTVTFPVPMFGFEATDVMVSSGVVQGFTGMDGDAVYTLEVAGPAEGALTASIAAAVAQDGGGFGNAPASFEIVYDITGPTVVLSTAVGDPTNQSPFEAVATFNEPVVGLEAADIAITNGSVANFATADGGQTWTFDVTPVENQTVSLTVLAGSTTDLAGNPNTASNTLQRAFDGTLPTVVMTSTAPDVTNADSITVRVQFSEPVTGFTLADLTPANATISNLQGALSLYTFLLSPIEDGPFSVTLAPNSVEDSSFNTNPEGALLERFSDRTAPVASITAVADTTRAGLTVDLPFTIVDDNPDFAEVYVRRPGQSDFEPTGNIVSIAGTMLTYVSTEGENGLYGFALRGVDTVGNEEPLPTEPDVEILLNTVINGAFTQVVEAAEASLVFPMTNDLDIVVDFTDASLTGELTVSRTTPLVTPPAGYDSALLLDESISIVPGPSLTFSSANLTWNYDPANAPAMGAIERVFRFDGGGLVDSYPVTPTAGALSVPGVTGFSDWYAGSNDADVDDWGDQVY